VTITVPILSQTNPIHASPAALLEDPFSHYTIYALVFQVVCLPCVYLPKHYASPMSAIPTHA